MNHKQVSSRVQHVGIIPSVRAFSTEDAHFANQAVSRGGIPIVEIAMNLPGAVHVLADLVKHAPDTIVGAGCIVDAETARQCLDAGASFLTTDALDLEIVAFAVKHGIAVFPGALTPTEVLKAWKAGADLVRVIPCAQVGGESYIKALKASFPQIPLVAVGGVNQQTAAGFITAGASALGIGRDLIPLEALALRQSERIGELAKRFRRLVVTARKHNEAIEVEAVAVSHIDEFSLLPVQAGRR